MNGFPDSARRPAPAGRRILACLFCAALALFSAAAVAEPVSVRTVVLDSVLEQARYSAPATVVARNEPEVAAEIAARVLNIPVRVGDRVEAGDLLVGLDCRRFESLLEAARAAQSRAEAQQRYAERQLERARDLKKKNSISDELLDQRRTELASSRADASSAAAATVQAALDVDHCTVEAPIAAVVSRRLASVGSYVTPGTPLLGLIETAAPEVSVPLHPDQLTGFRGAGAWTFASHGQALPLRLRSVLPAADTVTRTREARLEFDGTPAVPGTAGRVVWQGATPMIPADYLVRRDGGFGIFVVQDDKARFIAIPGAQEGRSAPAAGLEADLVLVTEGRQRLVGDETVRRVDE